VIICTIRYLITFRTYFEKYFKITQLGRKVA